MHNSLTTSYSRRILQENQSLSFRDSPKTPVHNDPSSFYSRDTSREYRQPNLQGSPEIPIQNGPWQPGQRLPLSYHQMLENAPMFRMDTLNLQSMKSTLQDSIEHSLGCVKERLDRLENRVSEIEEKHNRFEMLHHYQQQQKVLLIMTEVETGEAHLNFRSVGPQ